MPSIRSVKVASGHAHWSVALWSAQAVLVAVFGVAGLLKLALPIDQLSAAMGLPGILLRFIGVAELAGAAALDPLVARVWPRLGAVAALGLSGVMMLAVAYHLGRGELAMIPTSLLLGALAAFVAWHRVHRAGAAR